MYRARVLIAKALQTFEPDDIWGKLAARADVAWRNEDAKMLIKIGRRALTKNPCEWWRDEIKYIISHELEGML